MDNENKKKLIQKGEQRKNSKYIESTQKKQILALYLMRKIKTATVFYF